MTTVNARVKALKEGLSKEKYKSLVRLCKSNNNVAATRIIRSQEKMGGLDDVEIAFIIGGVLEDAGMLYFLFIFRFANKVVVFWFYDIFFNKIK